MHFLPAVYIPPYEGEDNPVLYNIFCSRWLFLGLGVLGIIFGIRMMRNENPCDYNIKPSGYLCLLGGIVLFFLGVFRDIIFVGE